MKRIWLLLLLWAILWLGGSAFCAWTLQGEIQRQANAVLAENRPAGADAALTARALGQRVAFEGTLHRESDLKRAVEVVREQTRLPGTFGLGTRISPILAVTTESVRLQPKPTGWGVLAASAQVVRLRGVAGSDFEVQSIAASIRGDASVHELLQNEIVADPQSLIEVEDLQPTLTSALPLTEQDRAACVLAFAKWGSPWSLVKLDQPLETIRRRLVELGLPGDAWTTGVSSDVEMVRDEHFAWRANEASRLNLNRQPPGHVILAVRADTILLRGELGTPTICSLVSQTVQHRAQQRRVIDELVHSTRRRPETDAQTLASTFPSIAGGLLTKLLAVGTPSAGWKLINLASIDIEDESTLGLHDIPDGLDPRLVMPDVLAAVAWIHSIDDAPVRRFENMLQPHILIAGVGGNVYVRGMVAEESTRSQIETATRKLYATRSVDCAIRVDASCAPSFDTPQTLATLPAMPALNTTGVLAITTPGRSWKAKPMRSDFLDSDGLMRSNLLPDYVSSAQVMPDLLGIADEIRAHLAKVISGAPGIPLQAP